MFLHVNLPDGNSLRELKFFINVTCKKIIIINALDNQEVRNEALHNEVHDFLNKSFNVWRKVFGYNEQVMVVVLAEKPSGNAECNWARYFIDGWKSMTLSTLPPKLVYAKKFDFTTSPVNSGEVLHKSISINLKDAAAEAEAKLLRNILEEVKYNRTKAAQKLGIDWKTLFNKMNQYDI